MTLKSRITTAIATGAVLLNALAPVALAETVNITGNGAFSDNTVKLNTNNTTAVNQNNIANISNNVVSNASTGGNSSSFNTGGDNTIVTGDAATKVDVENMVNQNKANIEGCGACDNQDLELKITGNGAGGLETNGSENEIKVKDTNTVALTQDNIANIGNNVRANANTGKNDSSFNTGGDNMIVTGDAATQVEVKTQANNNVAHIGGNGGTSSDASAMITGNGAFSDNDIRIKQNSAILLTQNNLAAIKNDVYAKANTGKNDSAFNTGGENMIHTGDAGTMVKVSNLVNFNEANVACDCVLEDLNVKIGENGAKSDNDVKIKSENALLDNQANIAEIFNGVFGKAKTGYNEVSFGTGDVEGDPLIDTGDAWSSTEVSNTGNVNLFNEGASLHIPGDWDVDFEFNLSYLLSFLHLG